MARSLVKDSTIYGLGTLLGRAVGLLLIPIYTRYLDVSEYGALALLNLILQNVSFVCLLGVSTAAMRGYYEPGITEGQRAAIYGTASALLLGFPILVLAGLIPVVWWLSTTFLPSIAFYPLVFFTLLTGLYTPITKLLLGLMIVRRQALRFITFNVGILVLQAITAVVALAGLGLGLAGQVYAQFLANAVAALAAIAVLSHYARPRLDWTIARSLLAFGVPLVPFFVFMWMYDASGRFMLENFGDLASVGIFALAAQFAGLVSMAGGALDNVLLPHFMEQAGKSGGGRHLGQMIHSYLTWLGMLGLVVLVFASPAIRILARPGFFAAEDHVALLVLAAWLSIARTPITWSLNYSRQSGILSLLNGAAVVVLVTLLWFTLGYAGLGITGVALALISSNMIMVATGFLLAQRHFRVELPLGRLAVSTLTLVTGGALITWMGPGTFNLPVLAGEVLVMAVTCLVTIRLAGIPNPLKAFRSG